MLVFVIRGVGLLPAVLVAAVELRLRLDWNLVPLDCCGFNLIGGGFDGNLRFCSRCLRTG